MINIKTYPLLSLFLLSSVVCAPAKQSLTDQKIGGSSIIAEVNLSNRTGFINSYELMTASAMGMEIRSKAAVLEEKFHQELVKDEENLKKSFDDFQSKRPLMTQAAQVAEANRLKDLEESYKNKARRMQEELNAFLQEETTKLSMIIEAEIQSFAEVNGFNVVFDIATGRIVYCEQQLNKTPDLITLVNTKTESMAKEATKNEEKKTA